MITPEFIGQIYRNTANGDVWQANSLTPGDWTKIAGTGGGVQDMQVRWTPSSIKLGEELGFFTYGDLTDVPAEITFLQATSLAGIVLEFTGPCDIDFPNLVSIDPLNTQAGYLSAAYSTDLSLSLPSLTTIGSYLDAYYSNNLSLSLPALTTIGVNFGAYNSNNLSLSLPVLTTIIGQIDANSSTNLPLSLPALTTVGALLNASDSTITELDLSSFLPTSGNDIDFSGCNLTQTMVDHVLARCVASVSYVAGTVDLSGGTNSPPGTQGLLDVATLTARGVNVNVNP